MGGFKTYEKKKQRPDNSTFRVGSVGPRREDNQHTSGILRHRPHGRARGQPKEGMVFNLLAQRINYSNILVDTLTLAFDSYDRDMLSIKAEKFINPVYSIENWTFGRPYRRQPGHKERFLQMEQCRQHSFPYKRISKRTPPDLKTLR